MILSKSSGEEEIQSNKFYETQFKWESEIEDEISIVHSGENYQIVRFATELNVQFIKIGTTGDFRFEISVE